MVRYFFLSLNVLNSLLALAVGAVVYFGVIPLENPVARVSLPTVKETATPPEEQRMPPHRFPVTDYTVISDKNLFHPERKIPPEKQPEKAVPKPDLFLYGTLITSDTSYAFVDDKKAPYSTPGRGKRQLTLKKGDHLSGYILSEIEANRIVLVKGEEKVVVLLDDTGKRRVDESPAGPATARTDAAGIPPFPPAASSSPQAMPSPTPKVPSPGPGIAPPASRSLHRSLIPSLPQAGPSSAQTESPSAGPGMGSTDSRPTTRRGRIEAVKELKTDMQTTTAPK
jgi:hypothetical protein